MAIQNYAFKSVGSYLQDNTYQIPDYQREYSWEESQVEDFWMDLRQLRQSIDNEHFFGQIVIHNDSESHNGRKKYIIDGQQRTITSIIFLSVVSVICTELRENNCLEAQEISEDIQIKYIGRWSSSNDRLQLKLTDNDSNFFREYIQTRSLVEPEIEPKTKAQKRMKKTFEYLSKKIKSEIEGLPTEEKFAIINEYYGSFINGFKVMYVETTLLEEAFIIFESLNARGKGLEKSDLLKNHIFKVSKGQIESVKRKWENMLDNLEDGDATKFIRYYWNSKEEFVRTQSLYKEMKTKINTEGQCLQVATQLEKLSVVYSSISQKDSTAIFSNHELNEVINNLKVFGASSFYPVLLAMYNKEWDEEKVLIIMKEIEKLIFRNIIIAKNVANKYETFFASLAVDISNNDIDIQGLSDRLIQMKISDEEFSTYIERLNINKKPIIRYIFKKLNNLYASNETVISNSSDVHIEHIMPMSRGEWPIEEGLHEAYLWRLGNLTLLGEEFNKQILNKVFDKKKDMYQKSEIHITKHLVEYDKWDIEAIEKRQKGLALDALKIW
ncbi:DUF262 domain-containing protein [Halobacillus yeomjeoni]|uniref:DUF262 domain-containing protein n=1 Tax=Halobacillus yeomjeoni TaxID=311194 RepID=A0A931HXT9_9BACI|nr:DUF262 domain-containing protein [Halobacillus yeomjeoni]MBH0231385.1 DUF262 domain-containing protein [Halobacillus yeomjeoni]